MTILFDKLAYLDSLKRAGLSEEQARAYAEALEQATVGKTDQDAWVRIESKIDEQEIRKKAFWKAANNFGPILFCGLMLVILLK